MRAAARRIARAAALGVPAAGGQRPDAEALLARLKVDARWREIRFVPREQALQELQASEAWPRWSRR
jgi:hypothetical protein